MRKTLLLLFKLMLLVFISAYHFQCDDGPTPEAPDNPSTTTRKVEFVNIKNYYNLGDDITFTIKYENFDNLYNTITLKITNESFSPAIQVAINNKSVTGSGTFSWIVSGSLFEEYRYYKIQASYYETNSGSTIRNNHEYFEVSANPPTTDHSISMTNNDTYNCNSWGSPYYSVDIDVDLGSLNKNAIYSIECLFYRTENNQYFEYQFNHILYDQNSSLPEEFQVNLEFGGSLPDGTYNIEAKLRKYESNNWTLMATDEGLPVTVFDFTGSYSSNKDIEYDFHPNHDFRNGKENEIAQKLKTAFDPSFAKYTLKYTSANLNELDNEIFAHDDNLSLYAQTNDWDYDGGDDDLHILCVGYQEDASSNPNYALAGKSGVFTNYTDPSNYKFSFIFMDAITNGWGSNIDYVYKVIIHELGHQRAELIHASGSNPDKSEHNSPFCVMNQGKSFKGDNDDDINNDGPPQPKWTFYNNPHFCNKCATTLNSYVWKGVK